MLEDETDTDPEVLDLVDAIEAVLYGYVLEESEDLEPLDFDKQYDTYED